MRAAGVGIFCLLCPGLLPAQMAQHADLRMTTLVLGPLAREVALTESRPNLPIHRPDLLEAEAAGNGNTESEVVIPAAPAARATEASQTAMELLHGSAEDAPLRMHLWLMEHSEYPLHRSSDLRSAGLGPDDDIWTALGGSAAYGNPDDFAEEIRLINNAQAEDSFLDLAYGWVPYDENRPGYLVGDLYSQRFHAGAHVDFSSSTSLSISVDYFFSNDERALSVGVYAQTRF